MSEVRYCTIKEEDTPQRLDNYLIKILKGVPKSMIYRIIRQGEVRINKKRAKPDTRLCVGDIVRIPPVRMAEEKTVFVGQKLADALLGHILFEDARILVINKPSGIAVHGGSGVSLGVIEALRKLRPDLHYLELVHRIDRDTSGCLVLAKKRSALRALHQEFTEHRVEKSYWALLLGHWSHEKIKVVDAPLEKNILKSGERMVRVHQEGKPSLTRFTLLENYAEGCWVQASPKTGRTHQIRVHSQWLGHPIIGDDKYLLTDEKPLLIKPKRLYLHAREISFELDKQQYRFTAEVDGSFNQMIELLKKEDTRK